MNYYLIFIIPSVLLLLCMGFVIYSQIKVNTTFNKYSKVEAQCKMRASEVVQKLLDKNNISVTISKTKGKLTDNYSPVNKEIKLSESVYDSISVASIGVAAHETGHAMQDAQKYFPMKMRTMAVKFSNFASSLLLPLLMIGTMFWFLLAGTIFGLVFIVIAISLFSLGAIVNLITLPVEINASRRAMTELKSLGVLDENEQIMVKRVLNAAALTYVASLAVSLVTLLRLILLFVISKRD